jgi:hypothetical protein
VLVSDLSATRDGLVALGQPALRVFHEDDLRLNHLSVKIITLASALTNTGEHRETTVTLGDVVDEFHDKDSFADTSATEEANLSSLGVGGEEIDDFDAGFQESTTFTLLGERRRFPVDGGGLTVAFDGTGFVDGLTDDVHDTAQSARADGHTDGGSSGDNGLTALETIRHIHSNATDGVTTRRSADVSGHLEHQASVALHLQGVKDIGHRNLDGELNLHDGTQDRGDLAFGLLGIDGFHFLIRLPSGSASLGFDLLVLDSFSLRGVETGEEGIEGSFPPGLDLFADRGVASIGFGLGDVLSKGKASIVSVAKVAHSAEDADVASELRS